METHNFLFHVTVFVRFHELYVILFLGMRTLTLPLRMIVMIKKIKQEKGSLSKLLSNAAHCVTLRIP